MHMLYIFVACVLINTCGSTDVPQAAQNEAQIVAHKISEWFEAALKEAKDGIHYVEEKAQFVGHKIKNESESAGLKIKDWAENAGWKIKKESEDIGLKIKDGAEDAGHKIKDEFEKAGKSIKDGVKSVETAVEEEYKIVKNLILNACTCAEYSCGCCAHLEEPEISLNSTICANVTYLVHDYGVSFTVTVNNFAIFNETVSARNPPPVCLGVPYVKELADVCVRLYDINATSTYLHACVRVEARMKMILIAKYELGCFNLGPPGMTYYDGPVAMVVKETCTCVTGICSCSDHINIPRIHFHGYFRSNITYTGYDRGMHIAATVNDSLVIKDDLSAWDTHQMCFIPDHVKDEVMICMNLDTKELTGSHWFFCMKVETNSSKVQPIVYDFGCCYLTRTMPELLTAEGDSEMVMLPVVAAVVILLFILIFAATRLRKNKDKRLMASKKLYGSIDGLLPHSDPYC